MPRHDPRSRCASRASRSTRSRACPRRPTPSRLSEVERLNLPRALREFDLDTLNQYEAVRLFIARAVAVSPGFAVTNANAPAVAGIGARLHGMPLAIELAAARIKLLTPTRSWPGSSTTWPSLTAGSRDLPERQQTLRGAIAWSYDLLDDGARRLLDRLSVFRGGCDLEMAEAVCGPADELGGDVLDGLGELVDQSLVRLDEDAATEPRFAMLETIREYAAELLATRGEADDVRDRHAHGDARPRRAGGAAPDRRRTSGAGSTGSNASTTTCGPRSTGRRPDPSRSSPRGWRSRCGGSGSSAATSTRRAPASRRWPPRTGSLDPV